MTRGMVKYYPHLSFHDKSCPLLSAPCCLRPAACVLFLVVFHWNGIFSQFAL